MQNASRRRPGVAQRRRVRKKRASYLKYVLLAALVFAAVFYVQLQMDLRFGAEVFYTGTYVNGVSLDGYSYERAVTELTALSDRLLHDTTFELFYGDRTWTFTPADIGAKLDVTQIIDQAWSYGREGGKLERRSQIRALRSNPIVLASTLEYDESALRDFLYGIKAEIDAEALNAIATVVGYRQIEVSQSVTGVSLDADALTQRLIEAMTMGGDYRIELQPQIVEPEYTTEELIAATQEITTKATSTEGSSSKRTANIRLALSNFNGMCVPAGETISFNKIVGKRSPERGYQEAMEYAGTRFTEGFGGGTCQASTTLYCALIYSGLHIDERHNHTMTVGYVKPSLDAAVNDDGTKDLVFTNNSGYPIYIFADVSDGQATVSIYGKKPEYEIEITYTRLEVGIKAKEASYRPDRDAKYVYYEDETILDTEGKDGMRSEAWRYFKKDGEIVTQERLSIDYYAPQPNVYWIGVHTRENPSG